MVALLPGAMLKTTFRPDFSITRASRDSAFIGTDSRSPTPHARSSSGP